MIYTDEEIRLKKELADLGLEIVGFDGWSVMHGVNQGFRCAYCDRDFLASFNDYDSFQLDHITPQSCKGEHGGVLLDLQPPKGLISTNGQH